LRSEGYILSMFCSDPAPFLFVSFEMKKEDSLKPYDPKKSVWVPDGEGGYDEALITEVGIFVELYLVGKFKGAVRPDWIFVRVVTLDRP
jgi:hypothetical protein